LILPEINRIEALVTKAAALLESKGKAAAFAEFGKPDSEWWHGDTYLFGYDLEGNVLLNPAVPSRVGTNPHDEKDNNGKPFHHVGLEPYFTSVAEPTLRRLSRETEAAEAGPRLTSFYAVACPQGADPQKLARAVAALPEPIVRRNPTLSNPFVRSKVYELAGGDPLA